MNRSTRDSTRRSAGPKIRSIRALETKTRARLDAVIEKLGIRREFPPDVLEEVDAIVAAPGFDDPSLVDLTAHPFVTIDEVESRDLDQALYLYRRGDGFVVDYALADAAYAVRPGGALFRESLLRGASFYLPGFSIPMLPRALSEGVVSLNPEQPRRALVVRTFLDAKGHATKSEIFRARIISRAKLSYDDVDRWLAGDGDQFDEVPYAESLRLLETIGTLRIADQAERDVVRYHRRPTEVAVDEEGRLTIVPGPRRRVDLYNEQISLLCNIEGARFLRSKANVALQPVFKVHERPPESRVAELEVLIAGIVRAHDLDEAHWLWRSRRSHGADGESLAGYLARIRVVGPERAIARAIHRQAIWTNRRSEFAIEAAPHHGIGAEEYARFSSPMREVVGIFTHKEALEALGLEPASDQEADRLLQAQVVETANAAKAIQSRLDKQSELIALDAILGEDLDNGRPPRDGVVMGLSRNKVYVDIEAEDVEFEIKLYAEDLAEELGGKGEVVEGGAVLRGPARELGIGDRIRVRVRACHRGRWAFDLE